MQIETLVRQARWGVELVDALRGGPLMTTPRTSVRGTRAPVLRANESRWFLEDVPTGTYTIRIEAPGYVPTEMQRTIGTTDPGIMDVVELLPAPGYSFAPTTRRVAGQLRIGSADGEPAVGADVSFTVVAGRGTVGRTEIRSTAGGLYTMWLEPGVPMSPGDPAYPSRVRVDAELVIGATTFAGSVSFDLNLSAMVNGVSTLILT